MNVNYKRFDKFAFGKRLKKIRKGLNLTQSIMGEWLNVSPYTICHYEKGRGIPSIEFIVNFSNFTGIPVQDLIDMEKEL